MWYLSAELPTAIPGAFQPTGQLPNPVDSQYPSSWHRYTGSGWRHQTFDRFQSPPQGIRVCIQLVRSQLRGKSYDSVLTSCTQCSNHFYILRMCHYDSLRLSAVVSNLGLLPPKPDLKDLMHLQVSDWNRLGLALKLVPYDLNIIEQDFRGDTRKQSLKMFELWLKVQPDASYEQLIKALREVGDETVASSLSIKYGKYITVDYAEPALPN